jgi:hypothetical protein
MKQWFSRLGGLPSLKPVGVDGPRSASLISKKLSGEHFRVETEPSAFEGGRYVQATTAGDRLPLTMHHLKEWNPRLKHPTGN